jgi:hypothetical protein
MAEIIDTTMPRYQLPFEQLPRGFVPWPKLLFDALEREPQQKGIQFTDDYVQRHLEAATLRYFYEDLHVAYRPVAGGIEVLAIGWPEASPFLKDTAVKVVQA